MRLEHQRTTMRTTRGAGSAAVSTGGGYSVSTQPAIVVIGRDRVNSPQRERSTSFERKKGQVGGVWAHQSTNISSFGTTVKAPPSFDRRDSNRESSAGLASEDGVYEKTLVDSICAAGGLRPIPDAKQIKQFLDRCKNFDAGVMGGLIVAKLDAKTGK